VVRLDTPLSRYRVKVFWSKPARYMALLLTQPQWYFSTDNQKNAK
jgi:hypothetical protein